MQDLVVKNLENLSNIGYIDHFKHSHNLKENLFKSCKKILNNLGKKKFRGYVELFLDPVFRSAKDEQYMNMAVAAQDFILEMEKTYGENIFKAIVESHDERFVKDLNTYKSLKNYGERDFYYGPQGGGMSQAKMAEC